MAGSALVVWARDGQSPGTAVGVQEERVAFFLPAFLRVSVSSQRDRE